MSRVDGVRKLLALGDLHRSEINDVMGGDRDQITLALKHLVNRKDVMTVTNSHGIAVYRLAPAVKTNIFSPL